MKIDDKTRLEDGKLPSYAWPGGYPIYYLDGSNCILCPDCANSIESQYRLDLLSDFCNWIIYLDDMLFSDEKDLPRYVAVNYEDDALYCDACNKQIECAYEKA